jgi:ribose-phosphate pyrophosphokinase
MIGKPIIFSGSANLPLAEAVCRSAGLELGKCEIKKFSNDNIKVTIEESVRGKDVFIIQPSCTPVNEGIMELLIMIDAAKHASAARITAVTPYFPYSRSDKKDEPRISITARLMADLLETAGANRVMTMNLHSPQIQGFFRIPVDHLLAEEFCATTLPSRVLKTVS